MADSGHDKGAVRLGVVGITGYGWSLVQQIQKASAAGSCRLVAVADNQMSKAPERGAKLKAAGVALYDDAVKMYQALAGQCDGIYVATGINSHAPLTVAAFRAGFPVHLEKPAAATVQETDQMLDEMKRARQFCLVGFQAVHSNEIRFIQERLLAGRLGKVRTITCRAIWPRGTGYYARTDWLGHLRMGERWVLDGPASNALAHQVTNMLLLASSRPNRLAQPTAVRAELYAAAPITGHDTAAIEIRTAEGPTLYLLVTHCGTEESGPIIELDAEGGRAVYQYRAGSSITYSDGRDERCEPSPNGGRGEMIANFVEAVRTGDGSILRCPLAEARAETLAIDGAHESSGRIHRIAASHCRTVSDEDGGQKTVVDGLDGLLAEAAKRRCLLSDLPSKPAWAVATEAFDLTGYRSFPQRFEQ